ncbi:MAG: hypothetical protein ABSB35_33015 [Bryobacteraceae bacterium]|jgi:hypothetical protein
MPRRVPELEYGNDVVLGRVSHSGEVKWKNQDIFISKIVAHEVLGLRLFNERYLQLCFGPVVVGWVDGYRHQFHRPWKSLHDFHIPTGSATSYPLLRRSRKVSPMSPV